MFRYSDRKRAAGFLMGFCLWAAALSCCGQETEPEIPGICGEDQYVLLDMGSNWESIYDSQGNYMGKCRLNTGGYQGVFTIEKDSLISYTDNETWTVFSMENLENILELPVEGYDVTTCEKVCMVADREAGTLSLYDAGGNQMYSLGEGDWLKNAEGYARVLKLKNGYLMGWCAYSQDAAMPEYGPVWVRADGKETREITDPYLKQAFLMGRVSEFGDYLLVYGENYDSSSVRSLDGECLLEQVETSIYPLTNEYYRYDLYLTAELAVCLEGEEYVVYDTDLNVAGRFGAWREPYQQSTGGFITGVYYEELGGNPCDGFVSYCNEKQYPYTWTEGGCMVCVGGELLFVPLQTGETPCAMNGAYLITEYLKEDGYYGNRLTERKTGRVLAESYWGEDYSSYFYLGKDYCLLYKDDWTNGVYSVEVRNSQGEITYSSDAATIQCWENGYLYLQRGIYQGIADQQGNWIVRTINSWSE